MKFFSYLTYLTAFVATATHALPLAHADPEAEANALAIANANAEAQAIAFANAYADALSRADAEAMAEALAEAQASALALDFDLDNASAGFAKLTTLLTTMKTLLGGTLPTLNIQSIASLGVGLLNAVIEILGEATGLTSLTDTVQALFTDSVPAIGTVATNGGYDAKLSPILNAALVQYKQVLIETINLNLNLIPDIQSQSLISAGFHLVRGGTAILRAFREASG